MKKTIKSLLCAVALTGMGCSAMGQGNFDALPDCYKDLKPWIDDSTSGLVSVFCTEEWGGFGYDLCEIIRNPEENKVSLIDNSRADKRTVYTWEYSVDRKLKSKLNEVFWLNDSTGVFELWNKELYTYDENGKQKSSANFVLSYLTGNLELTYNVLNTYDENGKLQAVINVNVETGEQDTTEKYENGRLVYMSGYTKTERNDTTIFSDEDLGYSHVIMYDAKGNELFRQNQWGDNYVNTYMYKYNELGLKVKEEMKIEEFDSIGAKSLRMHDVTDYTYDDLGRLRKCEYKSMTGGNVPDIIETYEYDSKNQLIRKDVYNYYCNGSRVYEYAYDHKGNLTLEFDSYEYFYWGAYTNYEYEGGKKKYAPFDPAMYPTDKYPANSPVAKHGKLQVSGKNMVDVNGNIVQLRGISTHGIAWFPECYSESSVDALVDDWGINVLRIASYAENQIKEENGKDAEWHRTFIDSMVNLCERKGIYCIIDWHTLDDGTGDPWTVMDEAKEFFEYMSKKHAGKAHVMYEICNEPNYSGISNMMDCNGEPSKRMESFVSWARVKQYAQEIIDVIVKNDPSSIIIVGTPVWCQRVFAAANSPLDYPNAMYSLHFYSAASSHKDVLRANGDSAIAKNLPIFVSEFGTCGSGGSGSLDVPETIKWFKWMNDNNLSWVNWNFADKAESSCLLKPNSCEEQNWDNYTESGRIIKWALSDPELNGADSVLLVNAALKKNRYLSKKDIRFDYLGSCIAENPNFVTDNDIDGLVHCAYIKECLAEEPELAKDEARLDSCAKDKATDVALTNSSLHGVSVYPNPVKDDLVVDYDGGEFSVVLIDLLGSEVLREVCVQGKNVVNVSSLAPGCYLVKVESNGKFHFEKMSKE